MNMEQWTDAKNEKDCRNFDCNGVRTIFPLVELKECKTIKC